MCLSSYDLSYPSSKASEMMRHQLSTLNIRTLSTFQKSGSVTSRQRIWTYMQREKERIAKSLAAPPGLANEWNGYLQAAVYSKLYLQHRFLLHFFFSFSGQPSSRWISQPRLRLALRTRNSQPRLGP